MSFIGNAIGKITGASQAADAANNAANLQAQSAQMGIDEQKRQFDKIIELLTPYVTAGTGSLTAQQDILGLNGNDAQQKIIEGIQNSPEFQAYTQQGENAILQNASATGGLRGGNTQAALSQFRPQLLSKLIQQRFQNLGGITSIGQSSAAGQAAAGQQTGMNIADLLNQKGAAQAGGALASGSVQSNVFNDLLKIGGTLYGAGVF